MADDIESLSFMMPSNRDGVEIHRFRQKHHAAD